VPKWYEMSRAIELYINSDKKLNANGGFLTPPRLRPLGIDDRPLYAYLRHQPHRRWAAHVIEQLDDNRLIRPAPSTSDAVPSPYIPMDEAGVKLVRQPRLLASFNVIKGQSLTMKTKLVLALLST